MLQSMGFQKVEQDWTTEQQQLEYNCFTMLCYFLLNNSMSQPYVYICAFSLGPASCPCTPAITEYRAELPVLYSSFLLATYFTHGTVYIFQCHCLNSFHPPLPPLCSLAWDSLNQGVKLDLEELAQFNAPSVIAHIRCRLPPGRGP